MNISYRWLRELVPGLAASPEEVSDRLAMLGAPVDEVHDLATPLRDILIARVDSVQRHPNADRLNLCTVDAGTGEALQVVCGAPNVKAGTYYPFAPVGASLPDGMSIRKAKIRGETSQGMLCSARELGLGRDHDGILELHGEFETGRAFIDAVGLDDVRLAVDVTPNRPDLLSHLGVAREVAAAFGHEVRLHELPGAPGIAELVVQDSAAAGVEVGVDDVALCPRYFGLVIRGVSIGPSPEWLAARLRAVGLRPISNVVDATNYVLHELGQPLHAFDLDRLGKRVLVRAASAGERITTLDGVDRKLDAGMTVITDGERPVAVAGVMGGADTEVHSGTTDILLECALFDPRSVRATRRALGLNTDASYRFERGVDPDGMLRALHRAVELIVAVAGGTADTNVAAAGRGLPAPASIALRLARVKQVLGTPFNAEQIAVLLEPLGFAVADEGEAVRVTVPGHRRYDVAIEEDLIEELARRHGYDTFPDELRAFRPGTVPDHPLFALEDRLRTLLVGRGLLEAHTAAFAPESDGDVGLMLPLAATESRLRRALLPGLLRRAEYNFARGARSIRLFEVGTVFAAAGSGKPPHEATHLAIVVTGPRRPPHWSGPDDAFDVWDAKGLAEDVARVLGMSVITPDADGSSDDELPFESGLSFGLNVSDGAPRGRVGRVDARRIDAPAWADDVWGLEVELDTRAATSHNRYVPLPTQPPVERDLALLVPMARTAADVAAAVRESGGALLEHVEPFDVYSGQGVPDGTRSIAWRLRFRAADRTLTDPEVDDVVRRILQRLNDDLGIQQRS